MSRLLTRFRCTALNDSKLRDTFVFLSTSSRYYHYFRRILARTPRYAALSAVSHYPINAIALDSYRFSQG